MTHGLGLPAAGRCRRGKTHSVGEPHAESKLQEGAGA